MRIGSGRKIHPQSKNTGSETRCEIHHRQRLAKLSTIRNRTKKGGKYNSINLVNNITKETENKWTKEMKLEFPDLYERRGKVKQHKIHARLHKDTVVKQQKGRRVPIQLQDALNKEISRLIQEGHIVRVQELKEDVYLQPTVTTVKKDRSVKIALDARELNKNVVKDKYPTPNLDNLKDMQNT